jgi:uncharacterized membrane protein
VTNVLWDFGEGCAVTSVSPVHAYAAAGEYRVTAVAWDAAGQAAMCEMMVKVGERPARAAHAGGVAERVAGLFDVRW